MSGSFVGWLAGGPVGWLVAWLLRSLLCSLLCPDTRHERKGSVRSVEGVPASFCSLMCTRF